jgi:hypothetical protein
MEDLKVEVSDRHRAHPGDLVIINAPRATRETLNRMAQAWSRLTPEESER